MEELLKELGLEEEQIKKILAESKKEVKAKEKEVTETLKKNSKEKELLEKVEKAEETLKSVLGVLEIDVDELGENLEDVVTEKVKQVGGKATPEEVMTLQKTINKLEKDLKKTNTDFEKANATLLEERGKRQTQIKRESIKQALLKNNVLKPDKLVDLFMLQAKINETDGIFFDSSVGEQSPEDFIKDWAEENPEFIQVQAKGGAGSGASGGAGKVSSVLANIISEKKSAGQAEQSALDAMF